MLPHRLRCLGAPQLAGPDGEPVRFRTRKHLALLVYLASVPPVPQRRDRLAAMLWPRVELDEARHSLATALSVLRAHLGADAFDGTRDTIRLVPGRVVTDVVALEAGDPLELDVIGSAGFLEEFEVADAVEFGHWVDRERARLLPLVHGQLARRIEQCRRTGDSRTMERLAHELWRVDPLSEEAARAVLEARAMAGDRISGLRAFDQWRRDLAEQLGAAPSREVERIADRLRRHALDRHAGGVIAPVPAEQWRERPFVGRGSEFERCYREWQVVRSGVPRHVILLGEPGIGKSTIAGRVSTALALEGASVARVQCHELERELPFGVVGSLVEQLMDLPGAAATAPEHLAELARLVAKVRQRWPALPAPLNATGESARIAFTEAVMALVSALAAEQPVVVVCDDLHLADVASLAVLHLMLRRMDAEPLMVLATLTGAPGDLIPEAGRFALRPAAIRATVLSVGPLPEAHAVELLATLLGGVADPGPTVRRALLRGARGNPMVLELLVGDWRRRGEDSLALATGAMTRPGDGSAVPGLVTAALGGLDPDTRAVAELGALLGRRLNDFGMYTLVNIPITGTMRAMTQLTSQRILRDAGTHLEFANVAVRAECYQAMAGPIRRMLHSMVADRLMVGNADGESIPGLEVAWHLVRAERLPEAVPFLLAGGRESIRRGAPHECDLALSTGLPALSGRARRTGILLLAEALQELARWNDSLRVLALPSDPYNPAEEALKQVLTVTATRWATPSGVPELVASTTTLLSIAGSGTQVWVRVRALAALPYFLSQTHDAIALHEMGVLADALLPLPCDPYDRAHLLLASAWQRERVNSFPQARALLSEALALVDTEDLASTIAVRVLVGAGIIHSVHGEYSLATPLLTRAVDMALRLDNSVHFAAAAVSLATAHGRLGHTPEQIDWAGRALAAIPEEDWSLIALAATYEQALGFALDSHEGAARSILAGFNARCTSQCPAWAMQAAHLMRADVLALIGDEKRAYSFARKALAISRDEPLLADLTGIFARWRALVAVRAGEAATAAETMRRRLLPAPGLHSKDHVEVLASLILLEETTFADSTATRMELERRLAGLPSGIARTLRRFGMGVRDR